MIAFGRILGLIPRNSFAVRGSYRGVYTDSG